VWEEKYAEFESYDGMPERGTPLYLAIGSVENKGSIWSERRVKLFNCVEQKRQE
jgi:hypothetical protein